MENEFWLDRWKENKTGFHQKNFNPFLVRNCDHILTEKLNVLVPLCGKTKDLIFLSERFEKVLGVELSEKAVLEFFSENALIYTRVNFKDYDIYTSGNITLFRGDIFNIPSHHFKEVSSVYDRACIVALPISIRSKYIKFINELPNLREYFLHILSFDNKELGPPFSINDEMIRKSFEDGFIVELIESQKIEGQDIDVHIDKITVLENLILRLTKRSV